MENVDFNAAEPPVGLSAPLQAMWWLKKGGLVMGDMWERAHTLCQQHEGDRAHDLVHALCHWIEGDAANRNYWYARIANWQRASDIADEWQAIWEALTQKSN